jgi:signal transduction histidine kinase
VRIFILCIVYFATAKFGLGFNALNRYATIVWPPSGIALAALLIYGYRLWPGIFLGAFSINLYLGAGIPAALGLACGNTLEGLAAAAICARLAGWKMSLETHRSAMVFILAAVLSPLIAATIAVITLSLAGQLPADQLIVMSQQWWTGDCIGILTLTPLFLVFRYPSWVEFNRRKIIEALLLSVFFGCVVLAEFKQVLGPDFNLKGTFVFPFLLWASSRFGIRGGVLATLFSAGAAILVTAHGYGPFSSGTTVQQLVQVSVFVIAVAMLDLIVASFVAELRTSEKALSKAVGARDVFFSMASHELKTPVTALKLRLQILQRKIAKEPVSQGEISDALNFSVRQIVSLTDLVDDLLDVSRIRTGRFTLQPAKMDLSELVRDVSGKLSDQLAKSHCRLQCDLEDGVVGMWDRRRLEQVLINLVSNAIKYAPECDLKIQTAVRGQSAHVSVEDSGPGIDVSDREKVFERFERLDGFGTNTDGMGMGLYIVREIVNAHRGVVELRSELGKGSRFEITLPI